MNKQLVDVQLDTTFVKNWKNAFHSVKSAATVAVMSAAMEMERGAGMNASTSSTVTTRSMTAMANVFPRPSNVTCNVQQLSMVPLPLSVAKILN